MDVFLGIDTSCYTTSLCLVNKKFEVVADERIILSVKKGGRGLSQSNMVYQHTRNLPVLFERLEKVLLSCTICGIGVTDKPRRREDSYMPAFLAGLGYGRALAAVLHVPLYRISHQENHLLAVLRAAGTIGQEPFYGLHVSGGTTDFLKAVPDEDGLDISRIGGTKDISAGQFIDRIGVALGLPFPAGVQVDKMAQTVPPSKPSPVWCRQGDISFSGPESQGQRRIAQHDGTAADICSWTLATVWDGLRRMLDSQNDTKRLVSAGGVMSNAYLQGELAAYCRKRKIQLLLAPAGFSADNGSGAAFWAAWKEVNNL